MAIFTTPGGRERIQGWDGHHHRRVESGEREKHRKYSWIIEEKNKANSIIPAKIHKSPFLASHTYILDVRKFGECA